MERTGGVLQTTDKDLQTEKDGGEVKTPTINVGHSAVLQHTNINDEDGYVIAHLPSQAPTVEGSVSCPRTTCGQEWRREQEVTHRPPTPVAASQRSVPQTRTL